MPTGDAVQQRPTFEQEVNKFKGYTTSEGEIIDPKVEDLNPVTKNISTQERAAGAKTVAEAAAEEPAKEEDKPAANAAENAAEPAEKAEKEAAKKEDKGAESDEDDADDDTKTITVAEAKKLAGKRINELTRKNRALERNLETERSRNDETAKRLDALEAGLTGEKKTATSQTDKAPDPVDFEFGEMDAKFIRALARYEARQEAQEAERTAEAKRQREAESRHKAEFATKKTALVEAGEKEFDDFQEKVIDGAEWSLANQDDPDAWPMSAVIGELVFESKLGHKVVYHLATHPAEARKVFAMSPGAQGAWFARKELEFSPTADAPAKTAVKPSKAPAPPKFNARGGNGRNPVATDSPDFAAVEAQWRSTQRRAN